MSGARIKFSKVSRRLWNSASFRDLSAAPPNGQTLYQRLLTGPEVSAFPGLFGAWEGGLADALGWSIEGFREAFDEVSSKGMAKADWKAGLVWIPKAVKHNEPESPNVVAAWRTAYDDMPDSALKEEAVEEVRTFSKGWKEGLCKAFAKLFPEPNETFLKGSPHPSPYQEQEQEHEQEQEQERSAEAPRVSSGAIADSVVKFERSFWIAAYERGVDRAKGTTGWAFPKKAFDALRSVVEKQCVGGDRRNIQVWIERDVADFVAALKAAEEDPKYWSDYGPDGLLKWHNADQRGLHLVRGKQKPTTPQPQPAVATSLADDDSPLVKSLPAEERRRLMAEIDARVNVSHV